MRAVAYYSPDIFVTERRNRERRLDSEHRYVIRFEPNRCDRRSGSHGRRTSDIEWSRR